MSKMVKIEEGFNKILSVDPIAEIEKFLGKHHSEFSNEEEKLMLAHALHVNAAKNDYMTSLGDTSFRTTWNEFINIIKSYGFKEALHYDYEYKGTTTEQALLYYHPTKGLIIWATSYFNGTSLNSGTLHGQVRYPETIERIAVENQWGTRNEIVMTDNLKSGINSLRGCSHDAYSDIDKGITFSYDIRGALINKIEEIGTHLEFCSPWVSEQFLWFLDLKEQQTKDRDYKEITKEKILKCPDEFKSIVQVS